MNRLACCLLLALGAGATATLAAADEPATEDAKTFYALGVAISRSLQGFALSRSELESVKAGLSDGVLKQPLKVDMQKYGPAVGALARARLAAAAEGEKKAGEAYVAKAAAQPGARKTASGAIVQTILEGKGATPKATDTVTVNYAGTLTDGTPFDSSAKHGGAATFGLGQVIKCWTEGLQQVKVGGKARLTCPPELAYGDRGSPPVIKPGATLVFEIELLGIGKQ
jgi:FKBP-type peptidyl-prolyl cis-trans isomerase FkpA